MTDLGPLNIDQPLPLIDVRGFNPFGSGGRREPILTNLPRAKTALQNKYSGYMRDLATQYDDHVIAAMTNYDSDRVRRGQAPLSEEQTRLALEAAQTGTAQTQPRKKSLSPLAIPGNFLSNLGDIVKSIPRLPSALIAEGADIRNIPERISEQPNIIAGILRAPVVRMLPGTYTAGNIAAGEPGESIRNPLFTALDVLPVAHHLAKGTSAATVARAGTEAIKRGEVPATLREAARLEKAARRPITTSLTGMVDQEGNLIRNPLGQFLDVATETRMIRPLKQWFSKTERDVNYAVGAAQQRTHNIVVGYQAPSAGPDGVLDTLARDAYKLREDLIAMDPDLPARIPDIIETMKFRDSAKLTDTDLAAYEMYRELQSRIGPWKASQNYAVLYDKELYDVGTGTKLRRIAAQVTEARRLNSLRGTVVAGVADPADASAALATLRDAYSRPSRGPALGQRKSGQELSELDANAVSKDTRTLYRDGVFRALESSGYDIKYLRDADKANTLPLAIDAVLSGQQILPHAPLMNIEQLTAYIATHGSKYKGPALATMASGIGKGEWKVVSEALQSIRKSKIPEFNDPQFIESVRQIRETGKLLDGKLKPYTEKALARKATKLATAEKVAIPARFMPESARTLRNRMVEDLTAKQQYVPVDDMLDVQKIAQMADAGMWAEIPGFDPAFYRRTQREIAQQWKSWRDQGFDPIFIHTVTPNRIGKVIHPMEGVVPDTPISTRKRTQDLAPGANDFSIGVADEMREFLNRREIEVSLQHIIDLRGETDLSLRARYWRQAKDRADRSPVFDQEGHLQNIIAENYRKFDPDTAGYRWGSPYLNKLANDQPYIPISTYKNLQDIANPKMILGGVMDPATKLFRIAVVGTSLRTQIYNIVGGAAAAELHNPGVLWRQAKTIRAMQKDPTLIPDELKEMLGSGKRTMMELDDIEKGRVRRTATEGVVKYLGGQKLRTWWDDIQQRKIDAGVVGQPNRKFMGKVEGLVQKAYDLNGFFDDMYRMATYFDEYNRGIKKGYTHAAAANQGIGLARRVLQDWMGMTPMERGIMKSVFPFYGFIGHAIRFVLAYPLDHPLRAEFISKLAMAEIEDLDGLPTRFLGNLFLGGLDAEGKRNSLNIAPFNPFGDVANMMTVSGFLGATNPIINTAFQMIGVDQGTAELYPSLRYDPETGRLAAQHGNPLFMLAENTVPQTGLVTAALGINDQFNEMLQRDPAAANRFILSTMTVPLLWRNIAYTQEQFKSEVARNEAQTTVKNEALKSGDWSEASQYPSLAAYLAALDEMPDDMLSPYRPITSEDARTLAEQSLSTRGTIPKLPTVTPLDDTISSILGTNAATGIQLPTRQPAPVGGSIINRTGGT